MDRDCHDPTDYRVYTPRVKHALSQDHQLEKFEDRTDETVFSFEAWKAVHHGQKQSIQSRLQGKYQTQWRGMIMVKDPFTMIIYQQLMWDIKPRTIIELGSYTGASAVWFADTMKTYGHDSHVYSLDNDFSFLEPLAKEKRDDISFVEGDCYKIEKAFTPEFLKSLPHPWFVTEDAHANTVNVLHYLDQFTQPGDYIVVEDTNPVCPNMSGAGLFDDIEYHPYERYKIQELNKFMKDHSDRYRVDKRYNDFYGYNGTTNLNGFLKRV